MREWTLEQIEKTVHAKRIETERAVAHIRDKSIQEGWQLKRTRPRDEDEQDALTALLRKQIQDKITTGEIKYDKEKRVMDIAEYRRLSK